jgi:hypothetical protein
MAWRWALRGVSVSAALSVVVACARGQDGIDVGNADVTDPDGGSGSDARVPSRDGGADAKRPEVDAGLGCTGKVVINELQCDGPNGAEFIELFNPNGCAISLAGWKLPYRAKNGNSGQAMHSFQAGDSIAAGEFLLLGNDNFNAAAATKFNGGGGLGNDGGQVGLVDGDGNLIDAVGFGPSSGEYTEQSPAPLPSGSGSIGRKSDGLDTDNNAADFTKFATPSPGGAN